MRAVFDLDDTICVHENRDYANAKPLQKVVQKIRKMKDDGWKIIIYSSRGQISCNGDLLKIEQKNRQVAEDWLKKNNVPFDELVFGKPIADLYVDDKAMNALDFETQEFHLLCGGGSKRSVYRIGNFVKKDLGDPEETKRFKNWIEDNNGVCLYPRVVSYLYNGVYMEYINGENLVNCFTQEDLMKVLDIIWKFKDRKMLTFTIAPQLEILQKNKSDDIEFNSYIDIVEKFLKDNEEFIASQSSYSHGDFILSNVIKSEGNFYLIDQRYFRESSSYLFDLAKLRMSLMDYEFKFGISDKKNSDYLSIFDEIMNQNGIKDCVIGLNLMYICRLYRYKEGSEKQVVKDMARKVIGENEGLFKS